MTKQFIFKLNDERELTVDLEALTFKSSEDSKFTTVKSKSELFRQVYDRGMEVADIARETESHYSFVYGVISSSREMRETAKTSKSDTIRELAAKGMTPGEIAKQLNSNYSFVHSVVSKYKKSLEVEAAAQ